MEAKEHIREEANNYTTAAYKQMGTLEELQGSRPQVEEVKNSLNLTIIA